MVYWAKLCFLAKGLNFCRNSLIFHISIWLLYFMGRYMYYFHHFLTSLSCIFSVNWFQGNLVIWESGAESQISSKASNRRKDRLFLSDWTTERLRRKCKSCKSKIVYKKGHSVFFFFYILERYNIISYNGRFWLKNHQNLMKSVLSSWQPTCRFLFIYHWFMHMQIQYFTHTVLRIPLDFVF